MILLIPKGNEDYQKASIFQCLKVVSEPHLLNPNAKWLDASQKLTKPNGNKITFSDPLAYPLGSKTIKVTNLSSYYKLWTSQSTKTSCKAKNQQLLFKDVRTGVGSAEKSRKPASNAAVVF